ncbi:MAG TPA: DUF4253 domain-containing protein [Streptosporangiaceae bacterium]
MATGTLPEEGELRLGAVVLPPGRRIVPQEGPGEPVAWVTTQPVPDPGRVWSALSDAHLETGLVPIVLTDGEEDEDFFFSAPDDLAELDHLDAASVLGISLAPPEGSKLSMAECQQFLGTLGPAPIGLVPARRPADVLPTVGWRTADRFPTSLPIAAVLRSWEARFGARLLDVGPGAQIRLLVERPPRSAEAAQLVAAEHFAFCDERAGQGRHDIAAIAASLVDAPVWTCWWGPGTGPRGEEAGPGGQEAGPGGQEAGPGGEEAGPGGQEAGPGGEEAGPGGEEAGPGGQEASSE